MVGRPRSALELMPRNGWTATGEAVAQDEA